MEDMGTPIIEKQRKEISSIELTIVYTLSELHSRFIIKKVSRIIAITVAL
jgi:hypothetical protein